VLNSSSNITTGLNSLTATSLVATNLTGTLQTAAQPNVTSVGTLTSIATSGSLTLGSTTINESEIGVLDGISFGTAAANKALVLDTSSDIAGIHSLSASILTAGASLTVGGVASSASAWGAAGILSKCVATSVTDSSTLASGTAALSTFHSFAQPTLLATNTSVTTTNAATVYIANAPAASTNQTITNAYALYVAAGTSFFAGNVSMNGTIFSSTQAGYLTSITPGTGAASKALVLDSSRNITNINSLSTTVLAVGSPANTDLPVEIGYTTYQFSGAYAYSNSVNAHGLVDASGGISANYSLRADGRILVTGEVEITSDRRLKKNIEALTPDLCKSFVTSTTPVRFNWRNDDAIPDYGYIAQDVLKAGFDDLVTIVPQPGMEGVEDSDGFINPANGKFVFSPGKIIPMLALNQKHIFQAQDAKDIEIAELTQRLAHLEALVAQLLQKK